MESQTVTKDVEEVLVPMVRFKVIVESHPIELVVVKS